MDLAIGAKRTWVMMEHCTKDGAPKLVATCSYPLTAVACVSRVYTDLAVIDVDAGALRVREMAEGISLPELERIVGLSLTAA